MALSCGYDSNIAVWTFADSGGTRGSSKTITPIDVFATGSQGPLVECAYANNKVPYLIIFMYQQTDWVVS